MATTRLTDLVYGPLFLPATINRIALTSTIRNSGIATADAQMAALANAPGDIVQMPFWNDITGNSNVSSDDPAQNAVPNKIGMGQDTARTIRRNNGWQSANLVAAVLAEDPLSVISGLIADYWVREEQRVLGLILNGVFASASMANNVLDVATVDPATDGGVNMSAEVSANAHALLGDQGLSLVAVMMHSRVYWNLHAARAIEYGVDPVTGLDFARWDGKTVIVNDNLPRVAQTATGQSGFRYTSYFFANGAIGYSEATGAGGPKRPVAVESKEDAGNGEGIETVWYRRHWIMHPRGVAFTSGTVAGSSPSDAELQLGTNWNRVYDPKNVRIVAVITNG